MSADVYWEIVIILLLILLNGFFSLAEMSLVAAKKVRLSAAAKQGDKRSALALTLLEEPDRLFSTVQIGITLIGIITGAFGGATLGEHLGRWLAGYDALRPFAGTLGFGVVILAITYLTLVFGELIPKKMAFSDPERFARLASPLMLLLRKAAHPAVAVLSSSSRAASRLLGLSQVVQQITEEDIKGFINEGVRAGVVLRSEKDMLERVFRLGDRRVSSLMRHRSKVVWLDINDPAEDTLARMVENPYSRFPVCDGDLHAVLGVVKAREYLAALVADPAARLEEYLHAPVFIQDTIRATALLEAFQGRSRMHFAMVVDEYGDVMGIATLNDILEALVGDLPVLQAGEEPEAVKRGDGSWLLDGLIPMEDACQVAGICRGQDALEAYETLAGFILHHLQRIPEIGDVVEWEGFLFEIVDMDGRRIDRVLVTKLPASQSGG
ncbi:MAG: hemolysin family protein [Humidesulfovibrio sp.]|nr:hemolysin family protein [Humidesulfovibrio sp.]